MGPVCPCGRVRRGRRRAGPDLRRPRARPRWKSPPTPCSIRRRPTDPIVVKASNITIDGRGAWVVGATQGKPSTFKGIGVAAKGVSGVTLKNINAKGWDMGLKIEQGSKWLVENCDFSDNFHCPVAAGANSANTAASSSKTPTTRTLRKNKANHVWDACNAGRLQRQPDRGKQLLLDLEHLPEAVELLPQPLREEQPQSWHPHQPRRGPRPRLGRRAGPGPLER